MVNKVGISENFTPNPKFNSNSSFELKTVLNEDKVSINNITSIMCTPINISLEKSNCGVLVITDFKIKVIYSKDTHESLYVYETITTSILEIKTSDRINGEKITNLLKSNSLWGKVYIYHISHYVRNNSILLKVGYCASLDHVKKSTIAFSVTTSNVASNLYITDISFKSTTQITYDMNSSFPLFAWNNTYNTLFFVMKKISSYTLYEYNCKLNETITLSTDFSYIKEIIEFNKELYILGIINKKLGIYSVNKGYTPSEVVIKENILSFIITLHENNKAIYTLTSNTNGEALLTLEDFSLFGEDRFLVLDGSSHLFSNCHNYSSYIKDSLIYIVELKTFRTFTCNPFMELTSIKFISEIYNGDIVIWGCDSINSYLFLYSKEACGIKKITKKGVNILSTSLCEEGTTLLISLKVLGEINIVSIDLKNNFNNSIKFTLCNGININL
ncbi:MAG: hypothetical protein ACRC7N_02295 [Clostridium sp.]